MKHIGAELIAVRPGYCEIKLPYAEELTQQHGFFHAGVVATIADNASGYAAFTLMEASSSILTVEFKINLIAPGQGDFLLAKAEVLHRGRTITLCNTRVFSVTNGTEKLSAVVQASLMQLHDREDGK
ncbi:PaaI family thioesterase [Ulvibacter sp. MAR_2010_11]|uniref:PaaI family thioesterase n=1 Tax=Ulvibacter sp. MAR_2010_11 TaxID=1250229 RepID=UPI001E5A56AB|nr:PaaI family thioesterase [Ulvibacter sp. MAR_2010_11]